jgi:hypothetical protein
VVTPADSATILGAGNYARDLPPIVMPAAVA